MCETSEQYTFVYEFFKQVVDLLTKDLTQIMEFDQSADKKMPQGLDEKDEEEMELRKDDELGKFTLEW